MSVRQNVLSINPGTDMILNSVICCLLRGFYFQDTYNAWETSNVCYLVFWKAAFCVRKWLIFHFTLKRAWKAKQNKAKGFELYEGNLVSHRYIVGKVRSILIVTSDNSIYFSLILFQNSNCGNFLMVYFSEDLE